MKIQSLLFSLAGFALLALAAIVPPSALAQQTAQQPPVITEFQKITVQQPPVITEFQKIEDQWSAALVKDDQFTLETILSPTYVNISSSGEISTRDEVVAAMYEKGLPQAQTMEQRVVNVRVIEDVAVVDGTYIERSKLNGIVDEKRGIFTHVFQHVRGVWVCVHSQRTAVVEKSDEKKKTAKQSNADLPFHIPLFHKGAESTQQPAAQPAPQP